MPRTEAELEADLKRFDGSIIEAQGAVNNVLDLLERADDRRRVEGGRRWNRILDNLERALDLTRARLTALEQKHAAANRQLQALRGAAAPPMPAITEAEWQQIAPGEPPLPEILLPKNYLEVAEKILAMPLEALQSLTLDQVATMNAKFFEEGESETAAPSAKVEDPQKRSLLDERIERALRSKRARQGGASRTSPSFAERRKQKVLRDAVGKVVRGDIKSLTAEEAESVLACYKTVTDRTQPAESDSRLRGILEPKMDEVRKRITDLHKKQLQSQHTRPPV